MGLVLEVAPNVWAFAEARHLAHAPMTKHYPKGAVLPFRCVQVETERQQLWLKDID